MRWVLAIWIVSAATANAAPVIAPEVAAKLLYGDASSKACDEDTTVECMITDRYATDPKAQAIALALFRASGDIAGVGEDEMMDGGFRGKIHLVPQLPAGRYREHLAWVAASMKSIDEFFATFDKPPSYRWDGLAFRFVRSINKHTPSAYATSWMIEYNVEGSLLRSETGVRETLFHELFHLNDEDHQNWSMKNLSTDYDAIVAKCERFTALAKRTRCYAPFAPNDTKVIATGAYYAFQSNNGDSVHEYAAELALRYFKEQTEIRVRKKLSRSPFKCGPPENARSWKLLVDEFFGGHDLVPDC